jgi:uncharacterized protein (DUF342 family)
MPIELAVDDTTHVLSAIYHPRDRLEPLSRDVLVDAVNACGWNEAVLDDGLVSIFLRSCLTENDTVKLPVGTLLDGSFDVQVEPDHMSAQIIVEPPRGGAAVTETQVRAALAERGIVAGVLDDALREAIEKGTGSPVTIALGREATSGKPAAFENLIESPRQHHAKEVDEDDDNARIDYRDMGSLALVKAGDPLMRRTPAVQGEAGFDITGKVIDPIPVNDVPFAPNLSGAALSPDDPDLLVATIAGAPRMMQHGVAVSSLVEIESVDLNTGNVELDGTLRVKGDITMGMKVKVSGDVIVHGTVEAAEIHADGNITIDGGVIGMRETVSADGQGQSRAAHLICGGAVKARFVSNAEIDAKGSVTVEREVRQSFIDAGDSVIVGHPGSQNGVITGGRVRALKSVQAGSIGSMSAAPTDVCVGLDPHAHAKRAALQRKRKDLTDQKEKLEKLVLFLAANPAKNVNGMGDRARETLKKAVADVAQLDIEEAELNKQLEPRADAFIVARKRFYAGVFLHIGNKAYEFREDRGGCKAGLSSEGEIVFH